MNSVNDEKRFMMDVGMNGLPFPIKVLSRENKEGQQTIANISIKARIMQEFEAQWIDKFIQILHGHRDRIGVKTVKVNIMDYLKGLNANFVKIDFEYPFFIEKRTPVSKEKCLVRYLCSYSAEVSKVEDAPKSLFRVSVPAITTYPVSTQAQEGGLFGQLSVIDIETESEIDVFPEDMVELVDKHALLPVYSFLTEEDQKYVIKKIHSESKHSPIVIDEIKNELAHNKNIKWYSVRSSNYGMLHSYSTVIGTEKSAWIPNT